LLQTVTSLALFCAVDIEYYKAAR